MANILNNKILPFPFAAEIYGSEKSDNIKPRQKQWGHNRRNVGFRRSCIKRIGRETAASERTDLYIGAISLAVRSARARHPLSRNFHCHHSSLLSSTPSVGPIERRRSVLFCDPPRPPFDRQSDGEGRTPFTLITHGENCSRPVNVKYRSRM